MAAKNLLKSLAVAVPERA